MLRWALLFFIVAVFAAVLRFTGIVVAAAGIARFFFLTFLVLSLLTLLGWLYQRV